MTSDADKPQLVGIANSRLIQTAVDIIKIDRAESNAATAMILIDTLTLQLRKGRLGPLRTPWLLLNVMKARPHRRIVYLSLDHRRLFCMRQTGYEATF
jgi:hypothetical protein